MEYSYSFIMKLARGKSPFMKRLWEGKNRKKSVGDMPDWIAGGQQTGSRHPNYTNEAAGKP
jgi:hypothetical protein